MAARCIAFLMALDSLLIPSALAGARASPGSIQFSSNPDLARIRPGNDEARLTIVFSGGNGANVSASFFQISLDAPRPGWFFSTDIPVVEGKRLLEINLPASEGKASWGYVFPLRGRYELRVTAIDSEGRSTEQIFSLRVSENRMKLVVLVAFAVCVFALGVVGGRMLGPPLATVILILALPLIISRPLGGAVQPRRGRAETLAVGLSVQPAVVGQPAAIAWQLRRRDSGSPVPAALDVAIEEVEHRRRVFSLENIPTAGEFSFRFQFTDGSPHRVTAVARTDTGELQTTEKTVSVAAVEPPMLIRLRALLLFFALAAAGVVVGRTRRNRAPLGSG
jgi:hypothetical protein